MRSLRCRVPQGFRNCLSHPRRHPHPFSFDLAPRGAAQGIARGMLAAVFARPVRIQVERPVGRRYAGDTMTKMFARNVAAGFILLAAPTLLPAQSSGTLAGRAYRAYHYCTFTQPCNW